MTSARMLAAVTLLALAAHAAAQSYGGYHGGARPGGASRPTADHSTECGTMDARHVGSDGTGDMVIGEHPWTARLQYEFIQLPGNPSGKLQTACLGALVSDRYVLTTAYCVTLSGRKLVSVRLGEHDTRTSPDCAGRVCADSALVAAVERTVPHPEFSRTDASRHHDVGLVRLARRVPVTEWVRPICLPTADDIPQVGENLWFAGWTNVDYFESGMSAVKHKVALPVVPWGDCAAVFRDHNATIRVRDELQLCAGGERHTCDGDAGGPLARRNWAGVWSVVGLQSFGPIHCGRRGYPEVFTRVSHYGDWIRDNMVA